MYGWMYGCIIGIELQTPITLQAGLINEMYSRPALISAWA